MCPSGRKPWILYPCWHSGDLHHANTNILWNRVMSEEMYAVPYSSKCSTHAHPLQGVNRPSIMACLHRVHLSSPVYSSNFTKRLPTATLQKDAWSIYCSVLNCVSTEKVWAVLFQSYISCVSDIYIYIYFKKGLTPLFQQSTGNVWGAGFKLVTPHTYMTYRNLRVISK